MFIYGNPIISQPFDTSIVIEIFKNPVFNGKNILVIWEHKNIQALCDQIVRAYLYLNLLLQISEMDNQKLLNINTSQWWIKNSPIRAEQFMA